MSDYDFFVDFSDGVEELLEQCKQKIQEAIDWVCQKWDDTVDTWKQVISPAFAYLVHRAADKLEEAFKTLWDEFSNFCQEIWAKVDEMAGGPFELMQMSESYTNAAAHLRDEAGVVARVKDRVSDHWGGVAWDAFSDVIDEQVKAMQAVDKGLTSASEACAQGSLQIRSIWRDVTSTILEIVSGILDCIKDATDAGQWVTLDTGPAIKFYGKIVVAVGQLANQLESYFDENATVKVAMWNNLNAGLEGLMVNNTWPNILGSDQRDLSHKGGWNPK